MKLSIGEAANICGASIRALRYYDEIGLVKPDEVTDAGYRLYGDRAMADLAQVVFLRELEIPIKVIAKMLSCPDHDKKRVLLNHRQLLILKRRHIDDMICLIDNMLGGSTMKPQTTWKDIEDARRQYADEVKNRWGDSEMYKQSQARTTNPAQELKVARQADDIFSRFAEIVDSDPASPEAQALVAEWQRHITDNYYECTKPVLASLGQMYVSDERFSENIDRFGDGTAKFMSLAISEYCK
ncbi:MAG: MerR family transcriptional regulator [Clostridia bacterium]|nr:MerR family transcriptional regulator [Clostridia bacterium]